MKFEIVNFLFHCIKITTKPCSDDKSKQGFRAFWFRTGDKTGILTLPSTTLLNDFLYYFISGVTSFFISGYLLKNFMAACGVARKSSRYNRTASFLSPFGRNVEAGWLRTEKWIDFQTRHTKEQSFL